MGLKIQKNLRLKIRKICFPFFPLIFNSYKGFIHKLFEQVNEGVLLEKGSFCSFVWWLLKAEESLSASWAEPWVFSMRFIVTSVSSWLTKFLSINRVCIRWRTSDRWFICRLMIAPSTMNEFVMANANVLHTLVISTCMLSSTKPSIHNNRNVFNVSTLPKKSYIFI